MLTNHRFRFACVSTFVIAAMLADLAPLAAQAAQPAAKLASSHAKAAAKAKRPAQAAKHAKPASRRAAARPDASKRVPMPRARPASARLADIPVPPVVPRQVVASAVPMLIAPASAATEAWQPDLSPGALAYAPTAGPTASDIETLKEAIALARRGKSSAASARKAEIRDLVGQKLAEWTILRSADEWLPFARYAAFVNANPTWPSVELLRRRAEGQLWHERAPAATVLAFFGKHEPLSAKGRLSKAQALLAAGGRQEAQRLVRETWRDDALSEDIEAIMLEQFGSLLSRGDHAARLDRRIYADDFSGASRAAKRLGGNQPAIVQAAIAVERRARNAGALLEAVPPEARRDPAYMFSRIRWLRRNDRLGEAVQMMLAVPRDSNAAQDSDEWWIERRILVRELLDAGNPQAAYRIASEATTPARSVYRIDQLFTAGWVALRFLNDPITAMRHFSEMGRGTRNHIALGRAGYWLGRAAEAAGRHAEARRHYEAGALHATTYYGQLACARLGRKVVLRRPPALTREQKLSVRQSELVRAIEMLYAAGQNDLVISFVADVAERVDDPAILVVIADAAARHKDARAMLLLGKDAVARGFAFDHYAFPNVGIPKFASIGPPIDHSLVYSIARQESAFNQDVVSVAKAMGLMQVTPAAGRYIARKFGVSYDLKKLRHDPVYNTQMGAAEITDLVGDYDGNYPMAFAGYNAGRGRVKQWIERFGDPRDPRVDPVDWVERIPFSETRNYVQRVMENLQVYRARFSHDAPLTIEGDLRGSRKQ